MTGTGRFAPSALLLVAVLTAGCAGERMEADYDADEARTEIEAVNARFESFVAEQQWDSLMTLYTDDAMMMPQGAPLAEGGAIRDGFVQMGGMGVTGIDLETVDVETAGNTAYEVGRYAIQGPNGMEIDRGKFLVVWKQVDGEWKLHRDMFNMDQPSLGANVPSDSTMTDMPSADMPPTNMPAPDTTSADTSLVR